MSVVVGSGYTLHYFDGRTGEHVSVPLEDFNVSIPAAGPGVEVVVTYDEASSFTREDVERLSSLRPLWHERDLESALTPGDETTERRVVYIDHDFSGLEGRLERLQADLKCVLGGVGVDLMELRNEVTRRDLDNLSPYAPIEKRRPDWQDRGRQHKNRKKRSWRR